MKATAKILPVRRIRGEALNLFLLGDALCALCLPFALDAGADSARLVASGAILFVLTFALRLAVWGLGRLVDRTPLGALTPTALVWSARTIDLTAIREVGYRCAPLARLFAVRPSGLCLRLDDETLHLDRAPYWLRLALAFRCPDARQRPTTGAWVTVGCAAALAVALTVWARLALA